MHEITLKIESISKSFRVARQRQGEVSIADSRREALGRRTDRFWALRDISFTVARGETLGLIGPNGSGKSTLLKILAGVMTAESGRFEAQGTVGALLELGAGFHPDLTGLENVYLNGALLGLRPNEVDRIIPEVIAFAELERFMDMPVKHYSSGMTTRLGFSVATRLAPDILLMDETFATGDAGFQAKALEHIGRMKARGHTMILVSHDMETMLQLADRIVWLDKGRVCREGDPRRLLGEYRRSQHMDLYHMNSMPREMGLELPFEGEAIDEPQVRIGAVGFEVESQQPAANGETIDVEIGQTVRMELTINHPASRPEWINVETAWVRDDDRILAQSRTPAALRPEGDSTRLELTFGPWELVEASWRPAVALSPLSSPPAGREPHSSLAAFPEAVGSATSFKPRYYDRKLDSGTLRVVTPNTIGIRIIAPIAHQWSL